MKGSIIRKRYILVQSLRHETLSADLFRNFRCKIKFRSGDYAIYLATQFNKNKVINFIESYGDSRTIITSGTIRKCKSKLPGWHSKSKEEGLQTETDYQSSQYHRA
ncbi:hypothetical protein [Thermoplasma acidophilum]|uniref:Uncharacterized protein n=1 Tax=Thermoplasma acidophilum (strain ATCC 25905 / DSM 1728 / JCM 9062 / NBRC 15155 / AMRC-C165) TaxID=273075 RepID=Q9HJU6_THEAC|nr:hypothetical protein [Thermoplasma acidophilum]MCY0851163.1 hypothetical protein [Thermoplasma acidophilum]CAC11996.1 hypothetical protein [Thermoplasma acidophilum]